MEQSFCDACSEPLEGQFYTISRINDNGQQFKICCTCNDALTELVEQGYVEVITEE